MKVRVEVNGKQLAQCIQELSWVCHYISMQRRKPTCQAKILSWFFELDFRVRIRVGFSS